MQTIASKFPQANSIKQSASALQKNTVILNLLLAVLTILIMVFYLAFLTKFPVFIDEGWISNAAWNWLTTGLNFDTMHTGVFDQFGAPWLSRPFLGEIPLVISFSTLGLGFFQARLASWTMGCLLLITVVGVGWFSYSPVTGFLSALILSASLPFFLSSHYARQDIMLAFFVMLAYHMTLWTFKYKKWWSSLLAGFLVGVGVDIHQTAVLWAVGLAILYLVEYRTSILRQPVTWWCALGGLLGILIYAAIHILPNPQAFIAFYCADFSGTGAHPLPILSSDVTDIVKSFRGEFKRYGFFKNSMDLALFCASLIYLAVRRSKNDYYLLAIIGTMFTIFVLVVNNKDDYYGIYLYTFLMITLAETFVSLIRNTHTQKTVRVFVAGLLVFYFIINVLRIVRPIAENRNYDYYATTNRIKTVAPADARIIGMPEWWLGLSDYDYRSIFSISFYKAYNGFNTEQALQAIRPDVIVIDTIFHTYFMVDEENIYTTPIEPAFQVSRTELNHFLNRRGELVLEFNDPAPNSPHGTFQVYRINWDPSP